MAYINHTQTVEFTETCHSSLARKNHAQSVPFLSLANFYRNWMTKEAIKILPN
ncbi:MAG: hypothetical protein OFPI_15450 [Osedax symbiont Rs2]|nr:MAG: hypothetical protein OFPI_15450 [Osedax symbiont Rs2]